MYKWSPLSRVAKPARSYFKMEFPVVKATIRLSPIKKEKNEKFVVKEVKSASQRLKPAVSKVVEISVPREELNSRARHERQSPSSSVPLIELNINRAGFKVCQLLIHSIVHACDKKREIIKRHTTFCPAEAIVLVKQVALMIKHPCLKLPGFKNNMFSSIKFAPATFS